MSAPSSSRSGGGDASSIAASLVATPASEHAVAGESHAGTLAAVAHALQDAALLTARYGSTAAARERLDMLEREQEGLNDVIAMLRTRLRQSQRATASAESETRRQKAALISAKAIATIAAGGSVSESSSGGGGGGGNSASGTSAAAGKQSQLFDADGFVNFLKRRFACRGDLTLLLDALFEYQMQQSDGFQPPPQSQQQQRQNERVVLLTIEEVQTSIPSSSPATSSARVDISYSVNTVPSASGSSNSITSMLNSNSSSGTGTNATANGSLSRGGGTFGNIGIGVHHSYYHQSPEEEEQEIHLAAKQLLSPVTFTHVDDDDDALKQPAASVPHSHPHASPAGAPSHLRHAFIPIHHHQFEPERHESAALKTAPGSFIRAQGGPEDETKQLKKILPKKPRVKKTARAPSPLLQSQADGGTPSQHDAAGAAGASAGGGNAQHEQQPPPTKKRKVVADESSLVIKQNLVWPAERRNITEMKHSSRFLELSALEALDKQTPWNEMYKRRPLYSHVINYSELDERAKTWFVTTLKIQFVWRRELWERLHWLPMSESVCTGAAWEKYRQTRKRRAKHAVTAWRKVYAQSIQMIEAGILPDDIWCDPALWYMPANPIYWLPESRAVLSELAAIDAKHAVRCYHVYDLARHPFYALGLVDKYPQKHELPSFSAISMQHPGVADEDLASFAIKDAAPLLADLAPKPKPSSQQHNQQQQHHPKVINTKDASASGATAAAAAAAGLAKKRGPRVQKLATQQSLPLHQQQQQKSTVVVPQKLKTGAAAAASPAGGDLATPPLAENVNAQPS